MPVKLVENSKTYLLFELEVRRRKMVSQFFLRSKFFRGILLLLVILMVLVGCGEAGNQTWHSIAFAKQDSKGKIFGIAFNSPISAAAVGYTKTGNLFSPLFYTLDGGSWMRKTIPGFHFGLL